MARAKTVRIYGAEKQNKLTKKEFDDLKKKANKKKGA